MKRTLTILGALTLLSASAVYAAIGITGTAHDLSGTGTEGDGTNTRKCVYCHTPHNASTTSAAPLWNRTDPAGAGFTMYTFSPASTAEVAGTPGGLSLACLSCHDGTTALGGLLNVDGAAATITVSDANDGTIAGNVIASGAADIGTNLGTSHPIGVDYGDVAGDPLRFKNIASAAALPLEDRGGTNNASVECATCHNPHDDTNGFFLRVDNSTSGLCQSCHLY